MEKIIKVPKTENPFLKSAFFFRFRNMINKVVNDARNIVKCRYPIKLTNNAEFSKKELTKINSEKRIKLNANMKINVKVWCKINSLFNTHSFEYDKNTN